jgi:dUTP pyrophosphatase
MELKIKKLVPEAILPTYAKPGDLGLDLTATSYTYDRDLGVISYGTGLAVEIPKGFVGLLFPRSSVYRTGLTMTNSVGVVDQGYRGELIVKFSWDKESPGTPYNVGDRVAQLVMIPALQIDLTESELSDSDRGAGGFGSTGK